MSFEDMYEKKAELADEIMKELSSVEPRKKSDTTTDFDLLMKENKKKATRKFIMWMIILVAFTAFVVVGSVLLFDNLAGLATSVLK